MSRKHSTKVYKVLDSVDITTGPFNSEHTDVDQLDKVSYDVYWSGSVGINVQIYVEISNDLSRWDRLDFGELIQALVDNSNHRIEISLVNFKYCRLAFGYTGGVGIISADYKGSSKGA